MLNNFGGWWFFFKQAAEENGDQMQNRPDDPPRYPSSTHSAYSTLSPLHQQVNWASVSLSIYCMHRFVYAHVFMRSDRWWYFSMHYGGEQRHWSSSVFPVHSYLHWKVHISPTAKLLACVNKKLACMITEEQVGSVSYSQSKHWQGVLYIFLIKGKKKSTSSICV